MAYIIMAYTVMAYIVMAYPVMAYTVMAYIVMAVWWLAYRSYSASPIQSASPAELGGRARFIYRCAVFIDARCLKVQAIFGGAMARIVMAYIV